MNTISTLIPKVEAALGEDPRTRGISFEVINQNGLIILKGQVEQPDVRDAALNIAKQQEGVIDVVDEIELIHEEDIEFPEKLQYIHNRPTTSN